MASAANAPTRAELSHRLNGWFADHSDEMLKAIRAVVEEETPSSDRVRLDAFARRLAARYRAAGAAAELVPNADGGEHVRARFQTRGGGAEKPALILCHYDTVWPVGSLETHPFRIEEGKAYGPGIFDMQSSLILAEFAMRALSALHIGLPRPVTVLVTSDEEIGSPSSRALIEEEALRSAYVLVLESPLPGGVLKTARKGVGDFLVEVTGRAAHAGVEPEKGVNAIHEAAHQVLALQALGNAAEGTTVNVDIIQGGSASNVIPARCLLEVDTRAWTQAEADRVEQAIHSMAPQLPGAMLTVSGGWNRLPLERKATAALYERVKAIGAALGLELGEGSTGGGSDGNFTGALGVPTLDGLGVPGAGAHADHEHIEVDQVAGRGALLAAMLAQL
jgi:glutamate carboxypeptidase